MAATTVRGTQITNATVQRQDMDTATVGQAMVTKIVQGTNVTLSSTGADSGTGDVTINVPTGGQGPAGLDAVTTTSGSFTVPPVGQTVIVNVVNAAWIALGQMVYVQGAGGTNLSGALQVQAISGNQLTLLNPVSPPAIPLASSTTSGLLNQTSGNTTDYVGGDNACHAISSAIYRGFISKTAAYTLTAADSGKFIICSGGSWTLTLPAPVSGLVYQLRNDMGIVYGSTTGTITLQPITGTIDGAASLALLPQQECTLITDGTNWRTFGLKREVVIGSLSSTTAIASITVLLPLGYTAFDLILTGVGNQTADVTTLFQLSTDGGNTWITANYYLGYTYNNSTTTVVFGDNENVSYGLIIPPQNASSPMAGIARITIWPGTNALYPSWVHYGGSRLGNQLIYSGVGILNQAGPVNAFKFYPSSGNLASYNITVKGIV
jgi:hypothetical protein